MRSDFCTYVHLRPDGTPFYVGKGTVSRALWKKRRANPHHQRIVAKHGLKDILVRIVKRGLTEEESFFHERQGIECLRSFGYQLCNLTDGGEGSSGCKLSAETRSKMSKTRKGRPGTPHTAETKARLSERAKARDPTTRMHSMETRAKISASHKGKTFSEEHRANLSKVNSNRSQEWRARIRASKVGITYSPETREKMRLSHTAKWHTEETKQKMSESAKRRWAKTKDQSNV